ncbi:hypothetical protein, partial [Pseudomonas syringae]|uniref:hypothetical protein n=1 Tax=Pseudomonas syringae TaxID=317 RepID=UPI001E28FD95
IARKNRAVRHDIYISINSELGQKTWNYGYKRGKKLPCKNEVLAIYSVDGPDRDIYSIDLVYPVCDTSFLSVMEMVFRVRINK